MHPIKHSNILIMHPTRTLHRILDAFHNPLRFFARILRMVKYGSLSANAYRLQNFFNSEIIVLDDRIRHLQYTRRRTVIVLQQNCLRALMELVKFKNAVDIGATPSVNCLIRVANHE